MVVMWYISHFLYRYKIKLRVDDGTGDSVFVLFDSDVHYLLEKQCSVLVANAKVCGLTDFLYGLSYWIIALCCMYCYFHVLLL